MSFSWLVQLPSVRGSGGPVSFAAVVCPGSLRQCFPLMGALVVGFGADGRGCTGLGH